jgi:membrane protease subunit HflK
MHRAYHLAPERRKRPLRWLTLLPWLAVAYLATGFYSVQPNEKAVVRRFGQAIRPPSEPGLHFGLPYGIDQVTRVKVAELKRVAVGVSLAERVLGRQAEPQQSECLTGDRNLIVISAVVQYRIEDPYAFLFHVANVPALVEGVAAAKLAWVVSSMNVDDVLTVERIAVQNDVLRLANQALLDQGAGVEVTAVSLEGAAPPQEVAEAFRDVTSAREDRQRAINEAEGYAYRLIPQARGQAQRLLLEAEGFAAEATQKAQGDAERFLKVARQFAFNRELTVMRLILETMEEVLPRLRKIVVDDKARQDLDLGLIEVQP